MLQPLLISTYVSRGPHLSAASLAKTTTRSDRSQSAPEVCLLAACFSGVRLRGRADVSLGVVGAWCWAALSRLLMRGERDRECRSRNTIPTAALVASSGEANCTPHDCCFASWMSLWRLADRWSCHWMSLRTLACISTVTVGSLACFSGVRLRGRVDVSLGVVGAWCWAALSRLLMRGERDRECRSRNTIPTAALVASSGEANCTPHDCCFASWMSLRTLACISTVTVGSFKSTNNPLFTR